MYHPTRDVLYLAWAGTQEVRTFETTTFTQIAGYNFGYTFQFPSIAYEQGRLKISRDGSLLFATVGGGVRYVNLLVENVNFLIAEKERACALAWINKEGTCKSLGDKLKSAKQMIQQNKPKNAQQILNDFVNELDAQKGKTVNQQAYDLLKTDALYLISTLR